MLLAHFVFLYNLVDMLLGGKAAPKAPLTQSTSQAHEVLEFI